MIWTLMKVLLRMLKSHSSGGPHYLPFLKSPDTTRNEKKLVLPVNADFPNNCIQEDPKRILQLVRAANKCFQKIR